MTSSSSTSFKHSASKNKTEQTWFFYFLQTSCKADRSMMTTYQMAGLHPNTCCVYTAESTDSNYGTAGYLERDLGSLVFIPSRQKDNGLSKLEIKHV